MATEKSMYNFFTAVGKNSYTLETYPNKLFKEYVPLCQLTTSKNLLGTKILVNQLTTQLALKKKHLPVCWFMHLAYNCLNRSMLKDLVPLMKDTENRSLALYQTNIENNSSKYIVIDVKDSSYNLLLDTNLISNYILIGLRTLVNPAYQRTLNITALRMLSSTKLLQKKSVQQMLRKPIYKFTLDIVYMSLYKENIEYKSLLNIYISLIFYIITLNRTVSYSKSILKAQLLKEYSIT